MDATAYRPRGYGCTIADAGDAGAGSVHCAGDGGVVFVGFRIQDSGFSIQYSEVRSQKTEVGLAVGVVECGDDGDGDTADQLSGGVEREHTIAGKHGGDRGVDATDGATSGAGVGAVHDVQGRRMVGAYGEPRGTGGVAGNR